MTALPERTDILIVGAGPTGMAAALSLRKHGCKDIVVVDDVLAGENSSRALVVHAATLEALDEIGCTTRLAELGVKAVRGRLWDGFRFHQAVNFNTALKGYTNFPFALVVPQHVTERVLRERMREESITLLRPYKVACLNFDDDDPEYTNVIFEDGQIVKARYVIGADGVRSTVRRSVKINYTDPDSAKSNSDDVKEAVLADVIFASPPPFTAEEFFIVMSNGNFFFGAPLPPSSYDGRQVWRIGTGIPVGIPPHAPSTEYLQKFVDAYGPGAIPPSKLPDRISLQIKETVWSTRFRTHSAIADTPFLRLGEGKGGPVVLIGDAAHLHPPAGGQGMNLGLRDAVFLGPVLAEHLKRGTDISQALSREELDAPLKKWAEWRHGQALKIIRLTKGLLRFAMWKNEITWYGFIPVNWARVRSVGLWFGGATGLAKKKVPMRLSGLEIR